VLATSAIGAAMLDLGALHYRRDVSLVAGSAAAGSPSQR
jgi:hypothetical protein